MENLLSEAFQRLSLLENDFDFSAVDKDKADELSAFISDDIDFIPEEPIIDVNAETEADLADNYIGKVILECECCHTRIYKDENEVVIDDESGAANIDEACPVCNNEFGYSVIGKIEAFDSDRKIEPEKDEEDVPEEPEEENEEDAEVEEPEEDEEEKDESLKSSDKASEDSKKLDEAHLPLADRIARKHLDSLVNEPIDEILDDAEKARMAEITKGGVVKAADRDEYRDLRHKELEEGCEEEVEESLKNSDVASEDSKKLDEAEDVCPECGKNPCTCEACEKEELDERMYDSQFDKDFDDAVDELERQEKEKKDELPPDDLPDPWGKAHDPKPSEIGGFINKEEAIKYWNENHDDDPVLAEYSNMEDWLKDTEENYGFDESLNEAVELHTDGEPVDLVKGDDGSLSVNVGGEEATELAFEEPLEAPVENEGEEIVPLDAEDQAAIEANEPEVEDEFAEEPVEDEFAEEPIEEVPEEETEEEEENEFESLEGSDKAAINESAGDTVQDKIAKEELKQAKIETKMMQLDLAAKQAEAAAAAPVEEPVEEVPVEEPIEVEEEVEDVLESITDLDETSFNKICETYLTRVYGNVKSFETSKVSIGTNKAIIEGVINFESGKSKNTVFNFANPTITKRGKLVMEGLNKTFSDSNKAFTLKFKFDNNTNLVAESMVYNYSSKQLNESNEQEVVRIYGRVKA